jgi:Flp pilus assembly protein TadD
MTSTPLDRNLDVQVNPQQEYRALIRSLKYTQGFGLVFVQCSPAEGERLIAKVRKDLLQKHIEVLSLTEPIETLYDKVDALSRRKPIDVLFVQGIEHSLYDYEKNRLWSDEAQKRSYSETGIPRLLQHLNLSRERFYEDFAFHFVFLVPHFALKYLTRRAPDFFDWRSGVFEFAMDLGQLRKEVAKATMESPSRNLTLDLPQDACRKDLLEIQALIEEAHQIDEIRRAELFLERGRLLFCMKEREAAMGDFNRVLKIKSDHPAAWCGRGTVLWWLGRYEEALINFDKALQFKPDYGKAWHNRGCALHSLGRYEEAIASFDKALRFKPDNDSAWYNRGSALGNLGRYEEAIASYDKALQLEPDDHSAWNNRGSALSNLGRYEEAIASYNKALQLKPDKDSAWYNRGIALDNLGRYEEAITSFDKSLQLKPDGDAWYARGATLGSLGRYEEAIASYNKALQLKPDKDSAWYNKACCYALKGDHEDAISSLSHAIELNPEKYREMAKNNSDFDSIRENERFQALVFG